MYARCQPYSTSIRGSKSFAMPNEMTTPTIVLTTRKRSLHKNSIETFIIGISESCLLSQMRSDVKDELLGVRVKDCAIQKHHLFSVERSSIPMFVLPTDAQNYSSILEKKNRFFLMMHLDQDVVAAVVTPFQGVQSWKEERASRQNPVTPLTR